ncbi:hypothetical protein MBLNU459_g1107t2 [Dothideomycetes sp. NU459]
MAMNFAPYQSSPPESTRALSPPLRSPTASPLPGSTRPGAAVAPPQQRALSSTEDPWAAARGNALPSPSAFAERGYDDLEAAAGPRQPLGAVGRDGYYVFETSLGIRMDIEAALAYLLVPPVGGVALLLFEHKSDYVSLVFTAVFVVHLIFSWSSGVSWFLFVCDLALIAWLVFRAYRDAETLDRLELPFFGPLASRFVDQE